MEKSVSACVLDIFSRSWRWTSWPLDVTQQQFYRSDVEQADADFKCWTLNTLNTNYIWDQVCCSHRWTFTGLVFQTCKCFVIVIMSVCVHADIIMSVNKHVLWMISARLILLHPPDDVSTNRSECCVVVGGASDDSLLKLIIELVLEKSSGVQWRVKHG